MEISDKLSGLSVKSEYERPRNIPSYLNRIKQKSKGTVRNINGFLSRFDTYLVLTYKKPNEIVLKEILALDEESQRRAIFDIMQDYVNHLSEKMNHLSANTISAGYIRASVYGITGYLRFFGFRISRDDVKDSVICPKIIEEERVPLTREQLQSIMNNMIGLRRTMYFVMTSSALRIAEVLQLRKRDFVLDEYDRIVIKVSAKIAKMKKPRLTMLTEETARLLRPELDKIDDDVYLFNQDNRKLSYKVLNEEQIFGRLRENLGFTDRYDTGIHHVTLTDSFRSWCVTKINRIDFGFGHALAGHESYMKRYDRMEIKEKIELYIRAEKTLQVNSYLDKEKTEKMQEVYMKRISDLEDEMNSVRELLKARRV